MEEVAGFALCKQLKRGLTANEMVKMMISQ